MKRDPSDLEKLSYKLQSCSPFAPDPSLRNMFTGVVATKEINVTRFQEFGSRKVQELNGKAAFTCSFKRSRNAKTLAFTSAVKVTREQTIDPALTFQRLLVVSQSVDIVVLVEGKDGQSLHSLCSGVLTRKVSSQVQSICQTGETPKTCAMNYHSLRTYLQVMTWMRYEELRGSNECH